MQENEAFTTIKDRKEGFSHRVLCRLLNPSTSNTGKIRKVLLDKINSAVLSSTKINQCKNTSSVITWFEKTIHIFHHLYVLMRKISFYLPPVIYSKNRLNLQDSSSRFLMMIYQSLCIPEKPFF